MRMLSLSGPGLGFDFGDDGSDYGGGQEIDWTSSSGGSGITAAQIANMIGSAAQAGSAVIRSTQTPSVIQGTNAIYNPANGQIITPGAYPSGGAPQISAGFTISPIVVVIALAAVVAFMGGRR